jgi:hypothetical protein
MEGVKENRKHKGTKKKNKLMHSEIKEWERKSEETYEPYI